MVVIPAIDLIEGKCVRLRQGSYRDTTVYDHDPVKLARHFVDAGATRIHLVDLDAARSAGNNRETIRRIRKEVSCTLEVGGGVRDRDTLDELLDIGVDFGIVGTILARDPDEVAGWAATGRGARMIASIDARDGMVKVAGWQEDSGIVAMDLARIAGEIGLAAVEYTDIARDGMLNGPDLSGTRELAGATSIPVILSGGIASTEDARILVAQYSDAIHGFIVGRALYEGTFDLVEAIELIGAYG